MLWVARLHGGMRLVQSKATPPVLRPGTSAIDWVRRWLGACVFAVPAVLRMPFAASAAEPTRSALLGLALIVALGAGATMIFSGVQWIRTEAREREYFNRFVEVKSRGC